MKAFIKKGIPFAGGVLTAAVVIVAYNLLCVSTHSVKLSCYTPSSNAAKVKVQYCVYHITRQSVWGEPTYQVLVGPTSTYGYVYGVSDASKDVSVTWDSNTDDLHIALTGSALTISPSLYTHVR